VMSKARHTANEPKSNQYSRSWLTRRYAERAEVGLHPADPTDVVADKREASPLLWHVLAEEGDRPRRWR